MFNRKRIEQLEERVSQLMFIVENPQKYKVGQKLKPHGNCISAKVSTSKKYWNPYNSNDFYYKHKWEYLFESETGKSTTII